MDDQAVERMARRLSANATGTHPRLDQTALGEIAALAKAEAPRQAARDVHRRTQALIGYYARSVLLLIGLMVVLWWVTSSVGASRPGAWVPAVVLFGVLTVGVSWGFVRRWRRSPQIIHEQVLYRRIKRDLSWKVQGRASDLVEDRRPHPPPQPPAPEPEKPARRTRFPRRAARVNRPAEGAARTRPQQPPAAAPTAPDPGRADGGQGGNLERTPLLGPSSRWSSPEPDADLAKLRHRADELARLYGPFLTPREAEYHCAKIMKRLGARRVRVTQASGDRGLDIEALGYAAEVKHQGKPIPERVVQQITAVAAARSAKPICFSYSGFSRNAIDWANRNNVILFAYSTEGEVWPWSRPAKRALRDGLGPKKRRRRDRRRAALTNGEDW
ncbi:restriction endonuclease [Pseudactinotalea terrae]|uniref:restriction endonuclease n=1 Tax=Pseudactinotalea terrae TaxID=1743262 RepID=UPI0013917575|nr:restriction endonuclease [Pseudactinotalea terrae]